MPISGLPTDNADNTVAVSPTGIFSADGQGGSDTLVVDYSSLATDIEYRDAGYGWRSFTDDFANAITFINFERYVVTGGSGNDTLAGGNLNDVLKGGSGADVLVSGLGADTLDGGDGLRDRWTAGYGALNLVVDVQLQAAGPWVVAATGATVSNIEQLDITTGIAADNIDTSLVTGNDVVNTGAGNDQFKSSGGFDRLDAGGDVDRMVIDYSDSTSDIFYTDEGYGWWRLSDKLGTQGVSFTGVESYDLQGGSGNDELRGGGLNDRLVGGAGDDLLNGGGGADEINGGTGTDTWQVNYSGRLEDTTVNLNNQKANTGAVISGIDAIVYVGAETADDVTARSGVFDDNITTAGGDDSVSTGRGRDRADGGAGNDLLTMDWSAIADPAQGIANTDQGYGWWRFNAASGDRLDYTNFDQYDLRGGAGNDDLNGGSGYDWLSGNGGDDKLGSGTGDATIDGGAGNDRWTANLADEIFAVKVNLQLSQTESQGKLSGSSVRSIEMLTLTTGAGDDVISAAGYAFHDRISTNGGNDTVNGGLGRDTFDGGAGGGDKLVLDWSSIADPANGISHTDQGYGWWRFGLADTDNFVDYINFEAFDLTGGAGNDVLTGRAAYDWLRGNGGNDTLNSGAGDALVDGGAGTDVWVADLSGENKSVRFEALASQTTAQGTKAGLSISNIEAVSLTTGLGADVISTAGFALDDTVNAGKGDDSVCGGLGRDSLDGGEGAADLLVADFSSLTSDVTRSDLGYGWLRYADKNNSVNTDFINFERFDLTGGSGHDRLFGGALDDVLKGGGGNDILNGYRGLDSINGGNGIDTWVADYANAATNLSLTLSSKGAGTLSGIGTVVAAIENVNLVTGNFNDAIDLSATAGDDRVTTNYGIDTVNVGQGHNDVADGGGDADTLIASAALSAAGVKLSDQGYGWLRYSSNGGDYTLDFINFESLNMTGSNFADKLEGLGGADTLNGGNGNDRLNGAGGNDTLYGGAGSDQFYFSPAGSAGVDLIADAASGDFIRIAGATLTGTVGNGTGGALLAGQVEANTVLGVTTLYIGLDGGAGADLQIQLNGAFGGGNLQISGTDILIL